MSKKIKLREKKSGMVFESCQAASEFVHSVENDVQLKTIRKYISKNRKYRTYEFEEYFSDEGQIDVNAEKLKEVKVKRSIFAKLIDKLKK